MLTLVVGLGNPGNEYKNTRHNIGFLVLEALAASLSANTKPATALFQKKNVLEAWLASVADSKNSLLLLKPATYMNLSGRAILKALSFYHLKPENLIVVVDDLDLPFGTLRMRLQGSSGGHNGLLSVQESLDTSVYRRVRMGVGNVKLKKVREQGAVPDFVLSPFNKQEIEKLEKYCQLGAESILSLVTHPKAETRVLDF